ncbi:hypothetical protein FSP39_007589 [Pinctada imbricata]|uniref:C-type lectin domain-containing protein n=1 Tax=Pinctada imbricata TaxID=66713 RepID=A0AA89C5J1_PINIB|nr:hypothetical protein FSP39_007589 [Pinctada imbricata]
MWESNMKKVEYTDFLKGQPNNHAGNEHCLEMYSTGRTGAYTWNDLNCDVQRKFVCEKGVKKNPCEFIGRKSLAGGRPLTIINNYKEK